MTFTCTAAFVIRILLPFRAQHPSSSEKLSLATHRHLDSQPGFCFYPGFPGGSDSKESTCNAGDPSLIPGLGRSWVGKILGWEDPGLGRSPGERNGNPLQYSCLENPMDRGAGLASFHRVTQSRTWLKGHTHPRSCF